MNTIYSCLILKFRVLDNMGLICGDKAKIRSQHKHDIGHNLNILSFIRSTIIKLSTLFCFAFFSTLFSDLKTPSKQEFSFVGQLVTSSDVMR